MPTSVGLHEDAKLLRPETVDRHRAITSLGEELEAIDWYDQRVDATQDGELKKILAHNQGSVLTIESAEAGGQGGGGAPSDGSLGIGSLKR